MSNLKDLIITPELKQITIDNEEFVKEFGKRFGAKLKSFDALYAKHPNNIRRIKEGNAGVDRGIDHDATSLKVDLHAEIITPDADQARLNSRIS